MLRIFRGQRHVEDAARPEQREQGGDAQAEHGSTIENAAPATANAAVQEATPVDAPTTVEKPTTGPGNEAPKAPAEDPTQGTAAEAAQALAGEAAKEPGFLDRGRMRRRARFLRAARELAYRDLGGLVFDLHRFGQRNDEIVKAKLDTLERIDGELRVLEGALRERRPVTVLREAGVTACPRCAAIHGSGDRFCPTCGLSVDQAERPIASPHIAPSPVATPGLPSPPALAQPPIPQPNLSPPAEAPAVAPAPAAAPGPAAAQAALPAAPMRDVAEAPEQEATRVIAPSRDGRPSQTVAFDPLSSQDGGTAAPEGSRRPGDSQ